MDETTKLYFQYEKMIQKRAWQLARFYALDYEDLLSEGLVLFTRALQGYDASKASFSTFLYHKLNLLNNYAKQLKKKTRYYCFTDLERHTDDQDDFNFVDTIVDTFSFISFKKRLEFYDQIDRSFLSKKAIYIIKYILSKPDIVCNRYVVKRHMRGRFNISDTAFDKLWHEIKRWWVWKCEANSFDTVLMYAN
jgi:hypothetical protein